MSKTTTEQKPKENEKTLQEKVLMALEMGFPMIPQIEKVIKTK